MRVIRLETWLLVCAVLLSTSVGCSSLNGKLSDSDGRFNLLKRFGVKKDQEPEFEIPKSMVGIWKASTFEKAGTKAIRGFGGRFYFYDANNEPVRVKGDLTIYGYDDKKQSESRDGKADRKFVFKADSLNSHFSESALGESYSFFVPWDNVGGEEKTITLIPVFKTADGHMPEAKPATIRLPGRRVSKPVNPVIQASAELPMTSSKETSIVSPKPIKRPHRTPSTFRLTPNLKEKLASASQRAATVTPSHAKEISNEGRAANLEESAATSQKTEDMAKQTPFVGKPNTRNAPKRVFGQPGAF